MDAQNKDDLKAGSLSTVREVKTLCRTNARALEAAALHTRSRTFAAMILDWKDDLLYVARKGAALERLMTEEGDGTNGAQQ
jgi:hypothetical protein